MIWPFFASALIGISFINLGALHVWVGILSLLIKIITIVLVFFVCLALWQRYQLKK